MGAYVISRLNRKIDDILDFTLCFFKKEKKKVLFNETGAKQTTPEHHIPYLMAMLQIVS